ncbi:hypothetical protein KIL84_018486 [Mauremys mutica]|uniref:Uncharacterized protein n=1 Tax=Mauremys mutica TaxID=74926 RepID=A0A9D3XTE6_9SAUR|nr:hypothetical protein KIL84_018486 [Mauremys mutica]
MSPHFHHKHIHTVITPQMHSKAKCMEGAGANGPFLVPKERRGFRYLVCCGAGTTGVFNEHRGQKESSTRSSWHQCLQRDTAPVLLLSSTRGAEGDRSSIPGQGTEAVVPRRQVPGDAAIIKLDPPCLNPSKIQVGEGKTEVGRGKGTLCEGPQL